VHDSLPIVAGRLLSGIAELIARITPASPLRPGNAQLTPRDPSTFALAIAGIATLAIYFAASGWRKSRKQQLRARRSGTDVSEQREAIDRTKTPKRGAA
jgi:hypothetical protein